MRTIKRSSTFKKDFRRSVANPRYRNVASLLGSVLQLLADDQPLDADCHDHPLKGKWRGHRDCHVCPDLVLIYRKSGNELFLVRLGSHSELF
jgi:mRNA interferase YafQ